MDSEIIWDEGIMKRIEELAVSSRPNTILVCVQGTEEGELRGEIYSCYFKDPIWFRGAGDLVPKLDEICDRVSMPHVTTDPRLLNLGIEGRYKEASSHHPQTDRSNLTYTMDQIPFEQVLRAREALITYVKYRQFSSLRGSIRGKVTKGRVVNFRSALKLVRMINMIQLQTKSGELSIQ